jgi:hypothetical protein
MIWHWHIPAPSTCMHAAVNKQYMRGIIQFETLFIHQWICTLRATLFDLDIYACSSRSGSFVTADINPDKNQLHASMLLWGYCHVLKRTMGKTIFLMIFSGWIKYIHIMLILVTADLCNNTKSKVYRGKVMLWRWMAHTTTKGNCCKHQYSGRGFPNTTP